MMQPRQQHHCLQVLTKPADQRTATEQALLIPYFQNLSFFQHKQIPKHLFVQLTNKVQLRTFKANSIVYREGEKGDLFYIVLRGSLKALQK